MDGKVGRLAYEIENSTMMLQILFIQKDSLNYQLAKNMKRYKLLTDLSLAKGFED